MPKVFVIIENGKVVDRVLSDAPLESNWVESETADMGDMYVNGTFIPFDKKTDSNSISLETAFLRAKRDAALIASDWTQLPDAPVDRFIWAAYRQQLRDITSQQGFPWGVVWPEPPVQSIATD